MKRAILLVGVLLMFDLTCGAAAEPAEKETKQAEKPVFALWPAGQMPGAKESVQPERIENDRVHSVKEPSLILYPAPADKANGAAVVICPGGGYGILAIQHEGYQVAEWLNSLGVTAVILKYRMKEYGHPAPLQDAQRAVATVRSRAAEWKVDPARIGILGFSAGGHLASSAATHFNAGQPDAADPIARVSCRPDFAILVYPVISFTSEFTHKGSRRNLLGDNPDPELVKLMSNELQVTPQTPPTFLMHTDEDRGVPPENSIDFFLALRRAKVPAELHVFQKGGHGFGLGKPGQAHAEWPQLCGKWLAAMGFLTPKAKK